MDLIRIACCAAALLLCSTARGLAKEEQPDQREIFVTIATNVFVNLEQPPVGFKHDVHTAMLEKENVGCDRCHPKGPKGALLFTFPKVRDESSRTALMNSYHDACIGCHTQRAAEHKKTGPTAADCGGCHSVENVTQHPEYVPIQPDYYAVLRDTYHKDCLLCHRGNAEPEKKMTALDWKSFYVKEQERAEATWPKVSFDYLVHEKHEKALQVRDQNQKIVDKKCDLCHYLAPEKRQQLAAEGKEPTAKDWLQDVDPTRKLTEQKAAHAFCINCHLQRKAEKKKFGPLACAKCHAAKERPLDQLANVSRDDCGQKEKMLIELKEGARAKAVPFNHKTHEAYTRSCQECHHQTLRACVDCHTVQGKKEGGRVTLAEAYHDESSIWSCIGCHEVEERKPNCAGCHDQLPHGLIQSACDACHTGSLTNLETIAKFPDPKSLLPDDTKDKLSIGSMENEYKPSKMPHLAIVRKLTELCNKSKLASYYHRDPLTLCAGCHHDSPLVKKTQPPQCATCHTARNEPETAVPTLLGAYHQQCLGCHREMVQVGNKKLPQNCVGCHEEKPKPGLVKPPGKKVRHVP